MGWETSLGVALAGALAIGTGAARAAEAPSGPAVPRPDWERRPSGEDLARLYPLIADALNIDGRATMHCGVTADGRLADCRIATEEPAGFGFGAAALAMAPSFKMRPLSSDGQPVGGGSVAIPIRFKLPERDQPIPAIESPRGRAAPSPHALELARKVVEQSGAVDLLTERIESAARDFETAPDAAPAVRRAAADTVRARAKAQLPDLREALAVEMAATFTEAELANEFATGLTGASAESRRRMGKAVLPIVMSYTAQIFAEVRDSVCQAQACGTAP